MATIRYHYREAIKLLVGVQAAFEVMNLVDADLDRMQDIMRQYQDAQFDFVDTAIMALSERLHITQVCTLDHRDFRIFRPRHCDYLHLLPE